MARLRLSPAARIIGFSGLLGLAGVAVASLTVPQLPAPTDRLHLAWPLLAAVFAFTEAFAIHVEIRRDAHSFSLNELPMVVGLFVCDPVEIVIARVVGGLISIGVVNRQSPLKVTFNAALFLLEAGIAATVFWRVTDAMGQVDAGGSWAGAYLAALATNVVGTIAVTQVIRMASGSTPQGMVARMAALGAVSSIAATSLALVGVTAIRDDTALIGPLAIVAIVMFLAYRGYASLQKRYVALRQLYEYTKVVSSSGELLDAVKATLVRARDLLRARHAELFLLPEDGDRGVLLEVDESGELHRSDAATDEEYLRASVIRSGKATLAPKGSPDIATGKDGLAAPLSRASASGDVSVFGVLAVRDRLGDVSTFDEEDQRVFETLANHAATSLENVRLLDRLRAEVAERAHQAVHDVLTGLGNRRLLSERTDQALRALEPGRRAAMLLLDLNGFKDVNDSLGHHNGDLLLQEIARRLRRVVPPTGTLARLGGDEFALVLPDIEDVTDAEAVAHDIQRALRRPMTLEDLELVIGAAIGIAIAPDDGTDAAALLQCADIAMYEAKEAPEGAVRIYDKHHEPAAARRLSLAVDLRRALEGGNIDVHYQPKARLATGEIVGVEALVRWEHEQFGRVPPDEFVAVAERVGLIRPLTTYVLERALAQWRRWRDEGFSLGVAVNLSARSLLDHALPTEVSRLLRAQEVPAEALTLELTESQIMADPTRTMEIMQALASLGVSLSIDDFGTGYSSLAYLQRLPAREVKIDRSFVLNMTIHEGDATIVRSTIELARNLGLRVVAEGVESQRTWDALATLRCDLAQGYYLSGPISGTAISAWLRERRALERPAAGDVIPIGSRSSR